jgi:hypothetical protein
MKEKDTGRIELPDKDPEEWKMFYDFVENSRYAKVEDGTRARILLPWFHEFQMTALVKECDDALQKDAHGRGKGGKKNFELNHELLSMSYVYDLPRTQRRVSELLDFSIEHEYCLFDLDSIKNIIPLLKSAPLSIWAIEKFIPDQLVKLEDFHYEEKMKTLAHNDLLPFLIHSAMRSKHELTVAKKERGEANETLSHLKDELQVVVDSLPNALANRLPTGRRIPTPGSEKIYAMAKRKLEALIHNRWRSSARFLSDFGGGNDSSRKAVRDIIQVPPSYNHDNYPT